MKRSVEWHEECLANMRNHLQRERDELERKMASVERTKNQVSEYARQIIRAKEEGLAEFDSDRYMKKRKPREPQPHGDKP